VPKKVTNYFTVLILPPWKHLHSALVNLTAELAQL